MLVPHMPEAVWHRNDWRSLRSFSKPLTTPSSSGSLLSPSLITSISQSYAQQVRACEDRIIQKCDETWHFSRIEPSVNCCCKIQPQLAAFLQRCHQDAGGHIGTEHVTHFRGRYWSLLPIRPANTMATAADASPDLKNGKPH